MDIGLACNFAVSKGQALAETIAKSARSAESHGLATFWGAGDREANSGQAHDPTLGIFVVARATTKIAIGLSGDLPSIRTAAVRAKQIATIDWFSSGRLCVGVDLDGPPAELSDPYWYDGTDTTALAVERYAGMRALWTQEDASFHGRHLTFDDAYALPQPMNRRVPLTYLRASDSPTLAQFVEACATPDGLLSWLVDADQVTTDAGQLAEATSEADSVRRTWSVHAAQFASARTEARNLGVPVHELVAWFDHVPNEREIVALVS